MSFLLRHRTICATIEEMREVLEKHYKPTDPSVDPLPALFDEAQDYARRMSARLMEYKKQEEAK